MGRGVRYALQGRARLEEAFLKCRRGVGHADEAARAWRKQQRSTARGHAAPRLQPQRRSGRIAAGRQLRSCSAPAGAHAARTGVRSARCTGAEIDSARRLNARAVLRARDGGRGGRADARSCRAGAGAARRRAWVRPGKPLLDSARRLRARRAAGRLRRLRIAAAGPDVVAARSGGGFSRFLTRFLPTLRSGLAPVAACAQPRRCTARRRRCARAWRRGACRGR